MTVIIGHKSHGGVFLFSDSALTRRGSGLLLGSPRSTFGETQEVDGRAVEELMPKVIELPRHVLSAFSGDVRSAVEFLHSVATRLKHTNEAVEDIVRVRTVESGADAHRFNAMFGYCTGGSPEILLMENTGRIARASENTAIAGSLPEAHRSLMLRLVNVALVNLDAPPAVCIAVVLTALQSMSINEILPAFGVGGAFFGAFVDRNGVTWQQTMVYGVHAPSADPGVLNLVNCVVSCLDSRAAVVASIDPPIVKRMELSTEFPGYSGRSRRPVTATDIDRRCLLAKHFAILSARDRKAVYVHADVMGPDGPVVVRRSSAGVNVGLSQGIISYFDAPSNGDVVEVAVCYRHLDGNRRADSMLVPLETPPGVSIVPSNGSTVL